jgi:hypothetical protein
MKAELGDASPFEQIIETAFKPLLTTFVFAPQVGRSSSHPSPSQRGRIGDCLWRTLLWRLALAGKETIPALVLEMTDAEVLEAQLVENLQRRDVHPMEEAEGYKRLLELSEPTYTVEQIAAKVGKHLPTSQPV